MKLSPIASNMTELELNDGTKVLFSYQTPVACIQNGVFIKTDKRWSNTTTRHINKYSAYRHWTSYTTLPQSFIDSLIKGV